MAAGSPMPVRKGTPPQKNLIGTKSFERQIKKGRPRPKTKAPLLSIIVPRVRFPYAFTSSLMEMAILNSTVRIRRPAA